MRSEKKRGKRDIEQASIINKGLLCSNIYFLIRFSLANTINNYLRLTIGVVCVGNF